MGATERDIIEEIAEKHVVLERDSCGAIFHLKLGPYRIVSTVDQRCADVAQELRSGMGAFGRELAERLIGEANKPTSHSCTCRREIVARLRSLCGLEKK